LEASVKEAFHLLKTNKKKIEEESKTVEELWMTDRNVN
jgi:hypothetical protein